MSASPRNPAVDHSFSSATRWRPEADALRRLLLECGLTEALKWGKPCYTDNGKNICIIQRMKDFLALLFFKGALLSDSDNVLEVQGPHSRGGYRLRFTSVQDVARVATTVQAYAREAIEIERAGRSLEQATEPEYPHELMGKFAADPDFKAAFDRLTPGRQRGYLLHFSAARQSKTRLARIEKYRRHIISGKGFQER
jgi:uncharacterized protein YdeI (YjbR/CyaY-like superfamily)